MSLVYYIHTKNTTKNFLREKQISFSQKAKNYCIIGNINKANLLVIIACQNILQSM